MVKSILGQELVVPESKYIDLINLFQNTAIRENITSAISLELTPPNS